MLEKIYEEYAILDSQIKALTVQKDELKIKILEEQEEKTMPTTFGNFTITQLKTWTYTSKVAELEEEFKAQKASEQSTGDATFEEKPSLRFVQNKL